MRSEPARACWWTFRSVADKHSYDTIHNQPIIRSVLRTRSNESSAKHDGRHAARRDQTAEWCQINFYDAFMDGDYRKASPKRRPKDSSLTARRSTMT